MSEKQYSDELTGIIGKNDMKREGKQDPDIRGRSKIGGIWYWVSGWKKNSANGSFYSLAYTEMSVADAQKYEEKSRQRNQPQSQQRQQQQATQQQQPPSRTEGLHNPDAQQDFDNEIPF